MNADKDTIVERSVREARDLSWRRRNWIVAGIVVVAVGAGVWSHVNLYVDNQQTKAGEQQLAEQVHTLGGTPVVAPPSPIPGKEGATGQPGRGIIGTQIAAGHLIVAYTDGHTQDVGVVVGVNGKAGKAGRGITGTSVTNGHLIVSYTDHTSADLGSVVGPKGDAGRSLVAVSVSSDFHLIVAYSDGSTADAGPLPPGPSGPAGQQGEKGDKGDRGVPGPTCPDGFSARAAVITEPDGSQHQGIACVADDDTTTDSPPTTTAPPTSGGLLNLGGN